MKNYIGVALVLLIAVFIQVLPVLAWDDCPLGLVNDPYPGSCPRYVDTNGDGICDHSQSAPETVSSAPPIQEQNEQETSQEALPRVTPQETEENAPQGDFSAAIEEISLLSSRKLRDLKIGDLKNLYGLPTESLISALDSTGIKADEGTTIDRILKEGGFSRSDFLVFLENSVKTAPIANSAENPDLDSINPGVQTPTESQTTKTSSTPTLAGAGGTQKGKPNPFFWTRGEAFALYSTLFLILVLKSLTSIQRRFPRKSLKWFTLKNYHFFLNLILLASFSLSFITGLMDFLSIEFGLFSQWGKQIVALHYNSSYVMLLVGLVHALWHIPYYRGCIKQTGKLFRKNRISFWKWVLNIFLTISFALSILSGLINYLALYFHWTGIPGPSLSVHIYSSLVLMGVSLLHTLWHLEYYRKNLSLGSTQKSKGASETQGCPVS
ncbi:MAG: gustatory receptor family protein [Caldiserica bacterium]|nr:gustatory receptor family protein [Caldisericota bacterium]MDH7561861.1 hypothetical protein [Caldisericota bacterium]